MHGGMEVGWSGPALAGKVRHCVSSVPVRVKAGIHGRTPQVLWDMIIYVLVLCASAVVLDCFGLKDFTAFVVTLAPDGWESFLEVCIIMCDCIGTACSEPTTLFKES